MSLLFRLGVLLSLLLAMVTAIPAPAGYTRSCRATESPETVPNLLARGPLPAGISGRVDFLAELTDNDGTVIRTLNLGDPDHLHPMASSFKPLVVHAALQDVDAGRLTLNMTLPVSDATRSLGPFPPGRTPVRTLLDIAINGSNNTAADLLLLKVGPERLARAVYARSGGCTHVLLTTKAWWTAQSGLAGSVLGKGGAAGYGTLPFEQRLAVAARLITASQTVSPGRLGPALDRVFASRSYDPKSELELQNITTPRSYLPLVAATLPGDDLSVPSRALLRKILSTGCCRPDHPRLKTAAWWAKGGITWRVLNLTGVVELPDGSRLAYVFMDDLSDVGDAGALRTQAPAAVNWIESQLLTLLHP